MNDEITANKMRKLSTRGKLSPIEQETEFTIEEVLHMVKRYAQAGRTSYSFGPKMLKTEITEALLSLLRERGFVCQKIIDERYWQKAGWDEMYEEVSTEIRISW